MPDRPVVGVGGSEMAAGGGMIGHADCAWKQVGPCVYCVDHGERLFQGDLPDRKRTIPRCEPYAHDWDDETGQGFYSHCRTCGLNEWYE